MRLRLRNDAPGLLAIEPGTPGRWGRRFRTVAWVNLIVGFLFVPFAVANPFCYIPMVCEAKATIDFVKDPLGFMLQKLVEANIWFLRKMLELMQDTTEIDLTSSGFLKQYAIIFAASSLLTVALWLIAVAKRAVRGVAVTTAVSEAVGFLLLQFVVNAMTPGAIALLMKAIDEVTAVFEPYAISNFKPFLEDTLRVMATTPGQGQAQLLVVNLVMLFGALLMWIELLIRSAAIYVAVALGPIVNAGLVDKDLWGKSKKWIGAIIAIGLTKPVLFALLGLGGAILSDSSGNRSDAVSKTLVGALILLLAVFASGTLYKWVPAFGDEMAQLHHDRKHAQSSGPASMVDGPGQHANRAIGMRVQDSLVGGGSRAAGGRAASAAGGKAASSAFGGGTAAAGPVGAAAAVAKAGVDMAKSKATSSPGAQGADASNSGSAQDRSSQGDGQGDSSGAPASARPEGPPSPSVVSSPPDWSSAGSHAAGGRPPGASGASGTAQPPSSQAPAAAASSPPAMPTSPSSASGTTSGSGPSITPPPARPSGGQVPGRPNPSKDQ
ncbi:hypothetical protein PUR57_33195 [Streptomyces sp. JV176]|uniref:hypothetical protein n=1 Tax=Streptomyces sp. JV176 TaxID=858630 RepID=UPI002E779742|nr:hypothetical protein [Streptomyces sp. JV176]MEE1803472.1 hypothetical protein [Streptomyces sp. JV176]